MLIYVLYLSKISTKAFFQMCSLSVLFKVLYISSFDFSRCSIESRCVSSYVCWNGRQHPLGTGVRKLLPHLLTTLITDRLRVQPLSLSIADVQSVPLRYEVFTTCTDYKHSCSIRLSQLAREYSCFEMLRPTRIIPNLTTI